MLAMRGGEGALHGVTRRAASAKRAGPNPSVPMPATRETLFARLADLGIATETVEHEAVFTVERERPSWSATCPAGTPRTCSSRTPRARLFLVVAQSHAPVDLKSLHKLIGSARLSFGKPELLMEVLGVARPARSRLWHSLTTIRSA